MTSKTAGESNCENIIKIFSLTEALGYLFGLKAVIFDLDDTLYDERDYVKSGYSAVSGMLPQVNECENKLYNNYINGDSAIDKLLTDEGIYSDELKQKCLEIYRNHSPLIALREESEHVLQKLKDNNYLLGIITDGRSVGQEKKIDALGVKKYFSEIIITDALGGVEFRKPNEKAFCIMKERMGCKYSEMCYVGDNIKKDFIAPQKLGMRCIWFKNKNGIYSNLQG